jgi:hypothetical protein
VSLLDDVAERAVLLGLEGGRGDQAHQMILDPLVGLAERSWRLWPSRVGRPGRFRSNRGLRNEPSGRRLHALGGLRAGRGVLHRGGRRLLLGLLPESPVALRLIQGLEELAHGFQSSRALRVRYASEDVELS